MQSDVVELISSDSENDEPKSKKTKSDTNSKALKKRIKPILLSSNIEIVNVETGHVCNSAPAKTNGLILPSEAYRVLPAFRDLLNMCLELENTKEMDHIINKLLIPHYLAAEEKYINSLSFNKSLQNVLMIMKEKKKVKFTGIKSILTNLKANAKKKRVEFVTLDSNVDSEHGRLESNNNVTDIIDLDELEDVEVIDLENEETFPERRPPISQKLKENLPAIHKTEGEESIENRICRLEDAISRCKEQIKECEESEVNLDSTFSSYIVGDKLKTKLLGLYKQLCDLTDSAQLDENKRSLVRLEVPSGQPAGPARRLEDWLNRPTKDNEDIQFPDFQDVVKCVDTANMEDMLGWSSKQVLFEARSLFIQCGRQLQQRRQKREWRDLMEMVEQSQDPAEQDPQLAERLNMNRVTAKQKEAQLIEYYTKLENRTCEKVRKKRKIQEDLKAETTCDNDSDKPVEITDDSDIEITDENVDMLKLCDSKNLLFIKKEEFFDECPLECLQASDDEQTKSDDESQNTPNALSILSEIEEKLKTAANNSALNINEPVISIIFDDNSDTDLDNEEQNYATENDNVNRDSEVKLC